VSWLSCTSNQANYNGNHSCGDTPNGEYRGKTLPVDSLLRNPPSVAGIVQSEFGLNVAFVLPGAVQLPFAGQFNGGILLPAAEFVFSSVYPPPTAAPVTLAQRSTLN